MVASAVARNPARDQQRQVNKGRPQIVLSLAHASGKHHKGEDHEKATFGVRYLSGSNCIRRTGLSAITDAKTKAECEKAGGVWIEETKKCGAKNHSKEAFRGNRLLG